MQVLNQPPPACCGFSRHSLVRAIVTICGLFIVGWGVISLAREEAYEPVKLLPPQPTITSSETKPVAEVGDQLNPTELVLGVTVNGQSRAYPLNMLTGPQREIINDNLGNKAIAATW